MDGGAWWATVHGVTKSQIRLSDFAFFLSFYSSFWRRKWQPTSVFLPGESHGQKDLVGYSLWGCKELDTTKQLTHTHTHIAIRKRVQHEPNSTMVCTQVIESFKGSITE